MEVGMCDCKQGDNIFSVSGEFLQSMTVLFQAIDHSPPFLTTLVGSTIPKDSSRSPKFSTLSSSFVVESCPLSTASKLTAFPPIMFFHSDSGNSRQLGELVSDRIVVLGTMG